MKNTIATVYAAAEEKLDRMSAHMGSADARAIKRHNDMDERIVKKHDELCAELKKSLKHAVKAYNDYVAKYADTRSMFDRVI